MRGVAARRSAVALILALVASTVAAVADVEPVSAAPAPPGECPAIQPLSGVAAGQTGNGWTVESESERERFRYEVLGIIPDGIGAGRDLIVVELSDTVGNDMLARAGGIWAGMSGSPVYLNGKLLGAVAYGFTAAPSMIGGVTPAEDMVKLLSLGAGATAAGREQVAVPRAMRQELADRSGLSTAQVSSLERLPVPLTVSGLNGRARAELHDSLERHGVSGFLVPSAAAPRTSAQTITARPEPGGNFAGVVSYGNLTIAGVGTTTYVCDDVALSFGHPFTWIGRSAYGANDASALAIVRDPAFGSFKLATIGGLFGTLDQDRLAGIRAALDDVPATRTLVARVTNRDEGTQRTGRTFVTMNEWVPDTAAFHLLANADSSFDRIGGGSARVRWTVTGTRQNGNPWQLVYGNRYASQFDITFESVLQLFEQLAVIQDNQFERISFTKVDIEAWYEQAYRQYSVEQVKVSKNGGRYRERARLVVAPGDRLGIRVWVRQHRGELVRVQLSLRVPNDAQPSDGWLLVGGALDVGEFVDPSSAKSFPRLLELLAQTPRNNSLVAAMTLFSFEDGDTTQADTSLTLNSVVGGYAEIAVEVQSP